MVSTQFWLDRIKELVIVSRGKFRERPSPVEDDVLLGILELK
jgi:hypothetical protein